MSSRLQRVQARMAETCTDLLVVDPSSHLVWLLGLAAWRRAAGDADRDAAEGARY